MSSQHAAALLAVACLKVLTAIVLLYHTGAQAAVAAMAPPLPALLHTLLMAGGLVLVMLVRYRLSAQVPGLSGLRQPPGDEAGQMRYTERLLELWTWLLALVTMLLPAAAVGPGALAHTAGHPFLYLLALALAAYNVLVHWVAPEWGLPGRRIAWHLVFITIATGLFSFILHPLLVSHGVLVLLVLPPYLATRTLGSRAGWWLLVLALVMPVLAEVKEWLRAPSLWSAYLGEALAEVILLALAGGVAMHIALEQRQLRHTLLHELAERQRVAATLMRLTTALTHAANAVAVTDRDGLIEWVNPAFTRLTGYDLSEVVGHTPRLLKSGRHDQSFYASLWQTILAGQVWRGETVNRRKDGSLYHSEITISPVVGDAGDITAFIGIQQDISARKQAEEQLRLAAQVFANTVEGIVVTDAATVIQSVNQAFTDITGYTPDEVRGRKPRLLHSDRHSPAFYALMWRIVQQTGWWQGEMWNRRKNGEVFPARVTISAIRAGNGEVSSYIGLIGDITQQKRDEQTIRHLAYHDPLTDLPNRTLFHERLAQALDEAERDGRSLAVLFVDLDGFKRVNDTVGHALGDRLLKGIAAELVAAVDDTATVARWGGDEFTILLPRLAGPDVADQCAAAVSRRLSRTWVLGGHEFAITASVGVAVYPAHGLDSETLLKNADMAMYHAKDTNRGAYQQYQEDMGTRAVERLKLESNLRRALNRRELQVHYQPQVDLAGGQVLAVEALTRWPHPVQGYIPPGLFIPVAEETGLISYLDEWVLRQASAQVRAWQQTGLPPVRLAVNLSARQFRQQSLVEIITALLAESGLDPQWLELEITEGTAMQDEEATIATLRALRDRGIGIALDDFGTGYSSLNYLRRLPITKLKIDRSFVRDVTTDHDNATIVTAVMVLARHLHLEVVAEGVETPAQLQWLQEQGCGLAQGYLFSPPVAAGVVSGLLGRSLLP